jgi:nicotinate-nucleotide adenylyltransferase
MAVMGGSFDPIHNGHLMIAKYVIEHKIADEVLFVPTGISPFKDGGALASSEDRIQMIKLAIEGCPGLSYSDMELNREGKSYTFDTMMTLKQIYPDVNMKFIIGMDNLVSLNCWHKAQELVNNVDFIIYPRPGFTSPSFLELEKSFGTKVAVRLEQSVLPDRIFERIEKPVEAKENKKEKNAEEKQDEANKTKIEEKVLGPDDFKPVEKMREVILPKSLLSSTDIREKIKNGEDVSNALPKSVLDYIMEKNLYRL